MIARRCRSCPQEHLVFLQATPEVDDARRETFSDFALAFVTWTLILVAYVAGAFAVAANV